MVDLSNHMRMAIKQAVAEHPDWTAEQFMSELTASVSQQDTRDHIEAFWLQASIEQARREDGPGLTVDEMRAELEAIIDDVERSS